MASANLAFERQAPLLQSDANAFQAGFETGPFACKFRQLFLLRHASNSGLDLQAKVILSDPLPFEFLCEPQDVYAHRAVSVNRGNRDAGFMTC